MKIQGRDIQHHIFYLITEVTEGSSSERNKADLDDQSSCDNGTYSPLFIWRFRRAPHNALYYTVLLEVLFHTLNKIWILYCFAAHNWTKDVRYVHEHMIVFSIRFPEQYLKSVTFFRVINLWITEKLYTGVVRLNIHWSPSPTEGFNDHHLINI